MFDPDRLITKRARSIDASGIRRVFDLAAKVQNPVNLSIGQPDFPVPDTVKNAAVRAIETDRNSYTVTQGIPELRERINREFDARFKHGGRWAEYGTLVTSGVSGALVLALMATVDPGDEVLVPDPYFVMYKHLTRLAGGVPKFIDTYPEFRVTAELVEPHITDRTKVLLISSPSNPTGVVMDAATWRELVDLCERRNILLVSDEIYDVFCYNAEQTPVGPRCPSPATYSDHVLVLRGYSKTYAMTGWRMGYAVGPKAIVEQMTKLQQYTFVCAPSMVQHAGLAAMELDMSEAVASYKTKRDMVLAKLTGEFEIAEPHGAFYAFPKVPTGETGQKWVERAIARDLLIIPGNVFSERDTHFRISYATDDATLEKGLDILLDLAKG
ncbi:MAG: aminotransferase class I/II-fold pyridoxal phosphate-dependent enzyme [Phycisphaera sp.]|nr:aminotransferase class I/II-fold pyridoxal phosphate-dependent enzyme [Phycisphaera sp.]